MKHTHLAVFTLSFVIAISAVPTLAADQQSPRSVALKAVTALFVDHDRGQFRQYVHEDADRKGRGAGSLLKSLKRQPSSAFEKFNLDRVVFFDKDNLDIVAAEYPDDLWDRLRQKLVGQLGCLAILKHKDQNEVVGLVAYLVETNDPNPQITYSDDN